MAIPDTVDADYEQHTVTRLLKTCLLYIGAAIIEIVLVVVLGLRVLVNQ